MGGADWLSRAGGGARSRSRVGRGWRESPRGAAAGVPRCPHGRRPPGLALAGLLGAPPVRSPGALPRLHRRLPPHRGRGRAAAPGLPHPGRAGAGDRAAPRGFGAHGARTGGAGPAPRPQDSLQHGGRGRAPPGGPQNPPRAALRHRGARLRAANDAGAAGAGPGRAPGGRRSLLAQVERALALSRMREAGAHLSTCESLLLLLLRDAAHPKFRQILPLIKEPPPDTGLILGGL